MAPPGVGSGDGPGWPWTGPSGPRRPGSVHNYATRTLARWVDEGRDLGVWLPYLSAYMGHATYTATAYYVHLLPQRIAATGLTAADGIIPEPPL